MQSLFFPPEGCWFIHLIFLHNTILRGWSINLMLLPAFLFSPLPIFGLIFFSKKLMKGREGTVTDQQPNLQLIQVEKVQTQLALLHLHQITDHPQQLEPHPVSQDLVHPWAKVPVPCHFRGIHDHPSATGPSSPQFLYTTRIVHHGLLDLFPDN